jgi:hypothetical protein
VLVCRRRFAKQVPKGAFSNLSIINRLRNVSETRIVAVTLTEVIQLGRSVASIAGQNLKDCNGIRRDDAYIIRGSPI